MQAETQQIVIQKGWYSDSLSIKNRYTQISEQEIKKYADTISGTLQFQNCNQPTLITTITHIPFSKLISIDLSNNSLTSIECLSDLYAPQLKQIRLCCNFIISIRNLRKGNWPNLLFLNLKQNKILDYQYLSQVRMKNNFESLTIATRKDSNKNPTQDVAWLAKIQPDTIYNINHYIDSRQGYIGYGYNYYNYENQRKSISGRLGQKLRTISRKFVNKNVFDTSNCYDLH